MGEPGGETQTRWASTAADKGADGLLFDPLEARQLRARVLDRLFTSTPSAAPAMGRYRILDRLGSGAMGVVYAAYDEQLDRKVALKLLRGTTDTTDGHQRMLREAKALAQLSHPHVVQVHDAGELEGEVFVAMEYVEGPTLRQWCDNDRRSPDEIVAKFIEAGRGLAAAHDKRIVHRDFKPDNVLIGDDGRARVADFGLAGEPDAVPDFQEADAGPLAPVLTQTGVLLGTPAYMAPEQFGGGRIDARVDQFAFAVALWEALFGKRPHAGETLRALANAAGSGPPPLPRSPDLPPRVSKTLRRALEADPSDRFENLHELLRALEPARRQRGRAAVLTVAGTIVVGAALGALAWRRSIGLETAVQAVASIDASLRVSSAKRALDSASRDRVLSEAGLLVSQDPTRALARLQDLGDGPWDEDAMRIGREAYGRGVASHVATVAAHSELLGAVGESLVLGQGQRLTLWRPRGASTVEIGARTVVVPPRGSVVFAVDATNGSTATVDATGVLTELDGVRPFDVALADPDGDRLGLLRDTMLTVIDMTGDTVAQWVLDDYAAGEPVALAPGGDAVFWIDAHHRLRRSDDASQDSATLGDDVAGPLAAAAGDHAIAVGIDGVLRAWNGPDHTAVRDLGTTRGLPRISADGRTAVAWGRFDDTRGSCWARLWQLDTGQHANLCGIDYGSGANIELSPDGRWLALVGPRGDVQVWNADSGRDWQPLGAKGARDVAFTAQGTLATLSGRELRVWTLPQATTARFSAITSPYNAKLVEAGAVFVAGSERLERWDLEGERTQPLLDGEDVRGRSLSSAGHGLASVAAGEDVYVLTSDGDIDEKIDAGDEEPVVTAISRDGMHVLFAPAPNEVRHYARQTKTTRRDAEVCQDCERALFGDLGFSPDSATGLALSYGQEATWAWDLATGREVEPPIGLPVLEASPDGTTFMVTDGTDLRDAKQSFAYLAPGSTEPRQIDTNIALMAPSSNVADGGLVGWAEPSGLKLHDFVAGRTWALPNQPALLRLVGDHVGGTTARYPLVVSRDPALVVVSGPLGLERHELWLGPSPEDGPAWSRDLVTVHPEVIGE